MMDHPNIAKVLDAGTTESCRPYFVMELVRGVPVNEYCDNNRVSIRERLQLFITICEAAQHAHQKGIIHRDLKPTNILVAQHDGKPLAKIIDFGVAKATAQKLTDKTLFTGFTQLVGTPLYMSPEQAGLNESDVDTRSDIYSLGVILYELLTGSTPFHSQRLKEADFDELRRIIREEEPPRPSARLSTLAARRISTIAIRRSRAGLSSPTNLADAPSQTNSSYALSRTDSASHCDRQEEHTASIGAIAANRGLEPKKLTTLIAGDLDWIVMKSLEKDRTRRYETASALAADVDRYLRFEPVTARPPSKAYQIQKFVRRNRGPLVAGMMIAIALLCGAAVSAWQAVRAASAEQAALDKTAREFVELINTFDDSQYHGERTIICQKLANYDDVFNLVTKLEPDNTAIWIGRAENRASRRKWAEAKSDYEQVIRKRPIQGDEIVEYAYLLLILNDTKAFQQFCQELINRPGQPKGPVAAFQIARACSAAPNNVIEPSRLVELATRAVKSIRNAAFLHCLGLANYRAGQYQATIESLQYSNSMPWYDGVYDAVKSQNWFVLAMAHHRLGHATEARHCLETAQKLFDAGRPTKPDDPVGMPTAGWIPIQVLSREANALLNGDETGPKHEQLFGNRLLTHQIGSLFIVPHEISSLQRHDYEQQLPTAAVELSCTLCRGIVGDIVRQRTGRSTIQRCLDPTVGNNWFRPGPRSFGRRIG